MLEICIRLSRVSLVRIFLFLAFSADPSFGKDFSLGPLLRVERDEAGGYVKIDALGPFITYRRSGKASEFGFRPLFYWVKDKERDSTEFDLLYPVATYDRREEDWRTQFLLYLLSYESNEGQGGFREKKFTFFPFVFAESGKEEEDGYFALFPIYGRIKDKFFRDEINFYLFPLFLQTKRGEATNNSFLWPFFGYYTGGQEGFRFWPVYGYRKVVGANGRSPLLDEEFALWPVYVSKERVFYGERMRYFSIFPLYSNFESPVREQSTYLWPLFVHQLNKKEGFERWDVPWPLINFTRGSKYEDRVFPFYARETDEGLRQGFFLWPLYKYKEVTLEDHIRTRDRVLLILYSDIEEKPIVEGGRSARRIDVWPLFSYKRDPEGNRNFHLLSILEPFLSGSEGVERNYSPFWRLYEWKRDKDGGEVSSFLWNTYRREVSKEGIKVHVKPIIPIISYNRDWERESRLDFLGGLFGYKSDRHKKTIKLFFLPINVSSRNKTGEEEVRKDEQSNVFLSNDGRGP